jgi:epoxyqueuosine reductase
MGYLERRTAERADPRRLAPAAASVIVVAVDYRPAPWPAAAARPDHGRIAAYAWRRDYHEAIKTRLFELDAFIRARTGRREPGRACVDTAPLLERAFAAAAGLGFIGRNTCLITPGIGSWTLLGALLVPEALDAGGEGRGARRWESALRQGCGGCTRCLAACPTHAFAGSYVLDARRCIAYLTIELRGTIPADLRGQMGNWVFGCDMCQQVCPYNRPAVAETRALTPAWLAPAADPAWAAPALADLLALDETGFRARFRGAPALRARRSGLVRNACVAAGNAHLPGLAPALNALTADPEPLIREHAAWALAQIGGHQEVGR